MYVVCSNNKQVIKSLGDTPPPAHTSCSPPLILHRHSTILYRNNQTNQQVTTTTKTILDWPVKKERKQECTHVDYNQLDDPLPFILLVLKSTECLCSHKSTILVLMILYGKAVSNWSWSTWVQSYFLSSLTSQSFVLVQTLLLCILYLHEHKFMFWISVYLSAYRG